MENSDTEKFLKVVDETFRINTSLRTEKRK